MPTTPDARNVVMVPVKRFDINISLPDILTPLSQMAARLTESTPAATHDSALHGHVNELSDLAAKLKDVVGRIHAIDSNLLAPGPSRPAEK
jgi:hypothetical protein